MKTLKEKTQTICLETNNTSGYVIPQKKKKCKESLNT